MKHYELTMKLRNKRTGEGVGHTMTFDFTHDDADYGNGIHLAVKKGDENPHCVDYWDCRYDYRIHWDGDEEEFHNFIKEILNGLYFTERNDWCYYDLVIN